MFAEAPTIDTAAPVSAQPDKKPEMLPIEVLVIVLGKSKSIVTYPNRLAIRWRYKGKIVWYLASDDPSLQFADPPLRFLDGAAPFGTPVLIGNGKQIEMSVSNTDPSVKKTGIQFHYDLLLKDGVPLKPFDPTVENDPPPPDPA